MEIRFDIKGDDPVAADLKQVAKHIGRRAWDARCPVHGQRPSRLVFRGRTRDDFRWEWETLRPKRTLVPVSEHSRAMTRSFRRYFFLPPP